MIFSDELKKGLESVKLLKQIEKTLFCHVVSVKLSREKPLEIIKQKTTLSEQIN